MPLNGLDRLRGFTVKLLTKLQARLGIQFKPYKAPDGQIGAKVTDANGNETWNGMIGEILKKDVSMKI